MPDLDLVVIVTLSAYIVLTLLITEWRMAFRRKMNLMDSKANTSAIDSLINFETVKYFNNEEFELQRYDEVHAAMGKGSGTQYDFTGLAEFDAGAGDCYWCNRHDDAGRR